MTDEKKKRGVADVQGEAFTADAPKAAGPKPLRLKVRRIGNSLGVVLPKEVLAKLRVGEGESLTLTETPDGVRLSAADEEAAELLRLAEGIMRKRRVVLKALAE